LDRAYLPIYVNTQAAWR